MKNKKASSQIARNIRIHNKLAKKYEAAHGEIYNDVEQTRLKGVLAVSITAIETASKNRVALDFGCGAGNLTQHISSLGLDVLAGDVSQGFLDLVASKKYRSNVEVILLNGANLSNIADGSVDMVATYSVLHHIPDYFEIIREFIRVLKPGGVLFIDHELCAEAWKPTPERLAFFGEVEPPDNRKWRKYLKRNNYVYWFILKFINPKYRPEGDIHVFADDHIEWDKIESLLLEEEMEIVKSQRYLLFKRGYDADVHEKYSALTSDMQFSISRKS